MNKRIKELDQQAVDYANNVCDANGIYKGKEYLTVVKEKFAELIIQECAITVIDRCEMRNADDVRRAEYHAKRIKQHFGVEE